jgi:hypothetical protein
VPEIRSKETEQMDLRTCTYAQAVAIVRRELTKAETALAGQRFGQVEQSMDLVDRALRIARHRATPKVGAGNRRVPAERIQAMYADYCAGMSLGQVGQKYDRSHKSVGDLFKSRGLKVRKATGDPKRLPNGQIAPLRIYTPAEIDDLIRAQPRIRVPVELKIHWRKWSFARRGKFIARMRELICDDKARPELPFSANVIPFDYATPEARKIIDRINAGKSSRDAGEKLNVVSQGVIWKDTLWFWTRKAGYMRSGGWNPAEGRPCLHHVIWEEAHGRPIPEGYVVRHADGNPNNLDPHNLTLATRNDVCRENHAAGLAAKSRDLTALLLKRSQQTETHGHETTPSIHKLRGAHKRSAA